MSDDRTTVGGGGAPGAPGAARERVDSLPAGREDMDVEERLARLTADHHRLFAELVEAEKRYRRLARAAWQVEEAERRRLSRDLHDGLGQSLTALKHLLSRLGEQARQCEEGGGAAPPVEGLVEGLDQAHEIAADALADAREMSRLLRPPMLDDLGLVPALRWLARSLGEGDGLRVDLQVEPPEAEERRLDEELETLVFRAVQESLTNVLKHAGTGRAVVRLHLTDDAVRVHVADAGEGFDPDATIGATGDGLGLKGLRERVALFGGRCRVASAPGQGTEIDIHVPLAAD